MIKQTEVFEIEGVTYVSADLIKKERKMGENVLGALMRLSSFPEPVRIGRIRFFDPTEVEQWFATNNK